MNEQLTADIVQRTAEGAQALRRSVEVARRNPVRAAFLSTAAVNVIAELAGAHKTARVANTALLPLLAASSPITATSAMAALAGAVGQWHKAVHAKEPTLVGVGGTIAPHVNYLAGLARHGVTSVDKTLMGVYSGVWAVGTALAACTSRAHTPAVAAGGIVVVSNAALAQNPVLRENTTTQGVSHGGNLLMASEGLTFVKNLLPAKAALLKKAANAAEAGLFAVGHLLTSDSLNGKGTKS